MRWELEASLIGARVGAIYQPAADHVAMELRAGRDRFLLLFALDPEAPRVQLTAEARSKLPEPTPFCMLLRKELSPARLKAVEQDGLERVLAFSFETPSAGGGRALRRLIFEAAGRHANLILTAEDGRIRDALRRVGGGGARALAPGRIYQPPPAQQGKTSLLAVDEELFARRIRLAPAQSRLDAVLLETADGLGPFAARQLLLRAGLHPAATRRDLDSDGIKRLWNALAELRTAIQEGRFEPHLCLDESGAPVDYWAFRPLGCPGGSRPEMTFAACLDAYRRERLLPAEAQRRAERLQRALRQARKRVERKLNQRKKELASAGEAEKARQAGDALLANLHRVPAAASSVTLPALEDPGSTITVALDPQLSPSANAQRHYSRYRKLKRAQTALKEQIALAEAELAYLDGLSAAIDTCARDVAALAEIESEMAGEGLIPAAKSGSGKSGAVRPAPPHVYASSDGYRISVGRNNRQNDRLTFHQARPDDIWLHAKQIPGSHVIIHAEGGPVPESTLIEAASVAAYYSKARSADRVPVDYTRRRHVRKPRGAKPGFVIYDHERTLLVTPKLPAHAGQCPGASPGR